MSAAQKTLLTPAEYLARERAAEFRSEFYRGEMFAMSGASWAHSVIKDNLAWETRNQLQGGPCRVVTSDLRVKVSATGLYTYPDLLIVCGEPEFEDEVFDTLLNPRVIVEILSDSTEKYDRGTKFTQYRQLSSLQEYVLVAQDRRRSNASCASPTTIGCSKISAASRKSSNTRRFPSRSPSVRSPTASAFPRIQSGNRNGSGMQRPKSCPSP